MERKGVPEKTTAPASADSSCLGHHRGVPCEHQEHEGVYHRRAGGGKVPPRRRSMPSSEPSSSERSAPAPAA